MHEFQWSLGTGDDTFLGWVTVLAYFGVAWLCLRAFMCEKSGPQRPYVATIRSLVRVMRRHWPSPPLPARRAAFWLVLFVLLCGLGLNKQLDLQTLLTDIARLFSKSLGFYEGRRPLQVLFILFVLGVGALFAFNVARLVKGQILDLKLALLGTITIVSFVAIRAASFHHVDQLLNFHAGGIRLNAVFELAGISMIGVAATRRILQARGQ